MKDSIFFFIILWMWGIIYVGLAIYIWFSKKAIGFWGTKKMFEVNDKRKYNHAMSKLYIAHGITLILLGIPLPAGYSEWIWFSIAGVVMEDIALIAVYSVVIKKKYKNSFK